MKLRENHLSAGDTGKTVFRGEVCHVRFWSPESSFCVMSVRTNAAFGTVTVVGTFVNPSIGAEIECEGAWHQDKAYGQQFKADRIEVIPPSSVAGILNYLASGTIRGIGAGMAEKMVEHFGEATLEVIEHHPERLKEVKGLGKKRLAALIASWAEDFAVRDIMVFLQSHGIPTAKVNRIYQAYGQDSMRKIKENPYRLAEDIHGIGFPSADRIAGKLGIPLDSPFRARAGITHVLREKSTQGHCAIPRKDLITAGHELLGIPTGVLEAAIDFEVTAKGIVEDVIADVPHIFLGPLYRSELGVASGLKRLLAGSIPPWGLIDLNWSIPWVERETGKELSDSQKDAVRLAVTSKVTVITGGPGTGKTTIVNSILKILEDRRVPVALCAPTGRAAKRLEESTKIEAKTIHRTLEFDPTTGGFKRGRDMPIEADLVVVDESSMTDVLLMNKLIAAIPSRAALLIVGDVDQLPSVGPGAVLGDIIRSGAVPTVRLTEIFRQASTSMIITNAHRINHGEMPIGPKKGDVASDFYVITPPVDDILPMLLQVVTQRIPHSFGMDPMKDVQILTPMHKGPLGTCNLNNTLQRQLNGYNVPTGLKIRRSGEELVFAVGDKVMQTANDYKRDVFNGDIGTVASVDRHEKSLVVEFEGDPVVYEGKDLDSLVLAYAISIHKSQGSEYPVVVMPLSMAHYMLLERNLLYTGVTRGKKLVVLIGEQRAIERAVQNHGSRERVTGLMERLWGGHVQRLADHSLGGVDDDGWVDMLPVDTVVQTWDDMSL